MTIQVPRRTPKAPISHELLVMTRIADLYATLAPPQRHRVHHHIGDILDHLPTIAVVQPEPEAPALPFHRNRETKADGEAIA